MVSDACTAVRECPVPVIARVNGYALGAGLELAASCDFRVASRNAIFGMPEVCFLFYLCISFMLSLGSNGCRSALGFLVSLKRLYSLG
jgi:enoyl-CoA hydratase/carnithine racemase